MTSVTIIGKNSINLERGGKLEWSACRCCNRFILIEEDPNSRHVPRSCTIVVLYVYACESFIELELLVKPAERCFHVSKFVRDDYLDCKGISLHLRLGVIGVNTMQIFQT